MARVMEEFGDQVYRPGDEVGELADLTDENMIERRREIEALFSENATNNGDEDQ